MPAFSDPCQLQPETLFVADRRRGVFSPGICEDILRSQISLKIYWLKDHEALLTGPISGSLVSSNAFSMGVLDLSKGVGF